MNLRREQLQAIQSGEAVRIEVEGTACVVVREESWRKTSQTIVDYSPLTDAEMMQATIEAGKIAGWDDPEMEIYNTLDPRKP